MREVCQSHAVYLYLFCIVFHYSVDRILYFSREKVPVYLYSDR